MKHLVLVASLAFCVCMAAESAWADDTSAIDKYRQKYEQSLKAIDVAYGKFMAAWPAKYVKALESIEQSMTKAGDLDGILAVRAEKTRFGNDKEIPEDAIVDTPVTLKKLQIRARQEPERLANKRSRKIVGLTEDYIKTLGARQKTWTTQSKVEDAIQARDEIKRVKGTDTYTSARFVVAEAEANSPSPAAVKPDEPRTLAAPDAAHVSDVALPDHLCRTLALYYAFDKKESTKVTDKSGKRHHGRPYNGKWTDKGADEGGYDLDGRRAYIAAGANAAWGLNAGEDWSLAMWVFPRKSLRNRCFFGRVGMNSVTDKGENVLYYQTDTRPGGLAWEAINGGWNTGVKLHSLGWQHIAVAYNASEKMAFVYVNGSERKRTEVKTVGRSTGSLRFGHGADKVFFRGKMDEIMIFGYALTAEDANEVL